MAQITFDENGFANADGFITTHNTDALGVYIGAQQTQVTKGFGLPAWAYTDAPDVIADSENNEIIRRVDGAWRVVVSHIGEIWYRKSDGLGVTITDFGSTFENLTQIPRPDETYVFVGDGWVVDDGRRKQHNIMINTEKVNRLLAEAEKLKIDIRDRILVGDGTTENQKKLKKLIDYSDALGQVNLEDDNPEFPELP